MFYAERIENCEIVERGVFLSIEEFSPYREKGWSGTPDTDAMADKLIIENLAGESLEEKLTSTNKQRDAITLLKECAAIHGQVYRQEWFVKNKARINAVVA